jgi:hypothetical protein
VKSFDFLPMVEGMSVRRSEPRTALMALVEVSWREANGDSHEAIAKLENRSLSGACIRLKALIRVGSRVRIRRPWEEFSGITKYCRRDGSDYVLGIQKTAYDEVQNSSIRTLPKRESAPNEVHPISKVENQKTSEQQEKKLKVISRHDIEPGVPIVDAIRSPGAPHPEAAIPGGEPNNVPQISPSKGLEAPRSLEVQAQQPSPGKGRRHMATKWLDKALGRQEQDATSGHAEGTAVASNGMSADAAPVEVDKIHANGDRLKRAKSQGDLQTMDDIYRGAGIMMPRMGYSINKVVEMLDSDHVRGLSKDAKRAAVLMALDAANVSIDEVLRDAQLRQAALHAYQADQRKHFEEYWAQKAEVNAQIQAEMDRMTALSLERIQRNLDEVAHEKAEFARWQTTKHREAGRISEAAELLSKSSSTEPPAEADVALSETSATAKQP